MSKTKSIQEIIKQKSIYCPDCGRKVMTHDGKGTIPISNLCEKCGKIVTYFPETNETTIKKKIVLRVRVENEFID